MSAVAYVSFEVTAPPTSNVEVEANADRGLAVVLEVRNTPTDLAALEDALRRTVVEIAEQRALVIELAREHQGDDRT